MNRPSSLSTVSRLSFALLLAVMADCGGTAASTHGDGGGAGSSATGGNTGAAGATVGTTGAAGTGAAGNGSTCGGDGQACCSTSVGNTCIAGLSCVMGNAAMTCHSSTGAAGEGAAGSGAAGSGSAGAGMGGAAGGGAGGTTSAVADGGAGTGPDSGAAGRGAAGSPPLDGGAAGSTMTASAYPPENPDISKLCTPAIKYTDTVPTTLGGIRFDMAFPDPVAWMQQISRTVCRYLYRKPAEVKNVPLITLSLEQFPPQFSGSAALTTGTVIELNVNAVAGLSGSATNIRTLLTGTLVHESTHVWQWTDGPGPVEAMADWVRYRAGFLSISSRPFGGNWNSPYATGAFFIAWVEDKYDRDWGYKINQGMHGSGFNYGNFIQQTFGKSPDALFAEYQADISK